MSYIVGLFLGISCVYGALWVLEQHIGMYIDDVGLFVVIGGTCAVGVVMMPWQLGLELFSTLKKLVLPSGLNNRRVVSESLEFIASNLSGSPTNIQTKGLPGQILKDGQELIQLQFSIDEIESILTERVHQSTERMKAVANSFRNLSKYPPAFGLVGTVFGLVNLMRAITDGLEPRQTGAKMAIALVATLYGLLMANLVVAPMGESLLKRANVEKLLAEIALQAVILAAGKTSLLKAQELLNSYVGPKDRANLIGSGVANYGEDAA